MPVTNPALFTVAIEILNEVHGFTAADVADPASEVVDPLHTFNVPVIVGKAFIVTLAV
jgi:hypothetical protein